MSKSNTRARPTTKLALIQKLSGRKNGADLLALQSATGWQANSVRAALSRLRRTAYTIDRFDPAIAGGASVYRITNAPEARQ
jgi:hypothetical protein